MRGLFEIWELRKMTYSTEDEVRSLLGNLRAQVLQATILTAIAGADSQINRMTFKTWTVGEAGYPEIQKASRYLAAAECLVNINGTEPTQQRLWDEAMLILQNITKFDVTSATGDFVGMSQAVTYPSNLQGTIWSSSRFPMLRKTKGENRQISDGFYWVNGYP
jgi:hypothetical protein